MIPAPVRSRSSFISAAPMVAIDSRTSLGIVFNLGSIGFVAQIGIELSESSLALAVGLTVATCSFAFALCLL